MKGINLKDMEPLTEEEKAFSADMENYDQLFKYMRINRLDQEEWYDILILHYLRAVKKYLNIPHLQQYDFGAVLFKTLDSARANYYKAMNTQKRMPEGGMYSLDYIIDDGTGKAFYGEAWQVDHKANIENQIIFKEMFQEFYQRCIECDDPECCPWDDGINGYLKKELDLLIEGYSIFQVNKLTEKVYPHGYTKKDVVFDMKGFRRIFKEVFGI